MRPQRQSPPPSLLSGPKTHVLRASQAEVGVHVCFSHPTKHWEIARGHWAA